MGPAGNEIGFFGDPHGDFSAVRRVVREGAPAWSVFLGDFDLDRPLEEELADLEKTGSSIHFIHGNHDVDRLSWYEYVFMSAWRDRNISVKSVKLGSATLAGLGGVYDEKVWHPKNGEGIPLFRSRTQYLRQHGLANGKEGQFRKHSAIIFPEDFDQLAELRADILVTHEAPSSHPYGFREIDDLAEMMGVKVIVHGHLHKEYEAVLSNGIRIIGMGKASYRKFNLAELLT